MYVDHQPAEGEIYERPSKSQDRGIFTPSVGLSS